jgi:hypothetical protein
VKRRCSRRFVGLSEKVRYGILAFMRDLEPLIRDETRLLHRAAELLDRVAEVIQRHLDFSQRLPAALRAEQSYGASYERHQRDAGPYISFFHGILLEPSLQFGRIKTVAITPTR